jgi:glycosyltransferase involved in cell wall biosynthesis
MDIEVVCLRPSEHDADDALNREACGRYQAIPFVYSGGSPYRDRTFVRRRLRDMRSALRLCRLVHGAPGQGSADVILFSNSAAWIVTAVAACRAAGSVCVIEKSEYPFINAPDTAGMRLWAWFFTRSVYKLVDGVIVISTSLETYFLGKVRRGAHVFRIPILADVGEFSEKRIGEGLRQRVLYYVGNLDHEGEVNGLLDAFCEIAPRFPEWILRVIGDGRDASVLAGFRSRVGELGMSDRIEFTGRVGRNELASLYRQADAFALPRASGLFSTAGFATKLAEYLATGRPVVVTATGDVPLFLRDGWDAFLVPPDDTRAFAARLAAVFADPIGANVVGSRGRDTAREKFDPDFHCRRLAAFLRNLRQVPPAT